MLIDEIEKLVDLVSKSSVSEVTIRSEERRITVRRATTCVSSSSIQPAIAGDDLVVLAPTLTVQEFEPVTLWITSPMVGIFHHSEPPVGEGTRVEKGQVVGVIESMKLMNEIRAEVGGLVQEILAEAGMAVEYGQPLFALH